jgi:mRNA-degrading endonuclease RelE of RelBE toxin-antitoxin system
MRGIIETPRFLASAEQEGLDEVERAAIVAFIAAHPTAGDIIPGTGGARKVRFAGRGRGKSGGYRVITYYAQEDIPVFLIDVYGKAADRTFQWQKNMRSGDGQPPWTNGESDEEEKNGREKFGRAHD